MGCFSTSRTQTDPEDDRLQKEQNKKIEQQLQKDKQVYRATHRLLLLGESTILAFFNLLVWPAKDSLVARGSGNASHASRSAVFGWIDLILD